MNKKAIGLLGAVLVGLVVLVIVLTRPGAAQTMPAQDEGSMDPQKLMIPRWFLSSLTLDGKQIELLGNQMTLQFEEGGKANGDAACNGFFTDYQAAADGSMKFGPIGATKMFCEIGMDQEDALFQALEKVEHFRVEGGKLTLSSADGQTVLVYSMPPK